MASSSGFFVFLCAALFFASCRPAVEGDEAGAQAQTIASGVLEDYRILKCHQLSSPPLPGRSGGGQQNEEFICISESRVKNNRTVEQNFVTDYAILRSLVPPRDHRYRDLINNICDGTRDAGNLRDAKALIAELESYQVGRRQFRNYPCNNASIRN